MNGFTSHLIVWLKEALRMWLLSLEKLTQVTPLLWACSNLRRHEPLCTRQTYGRPQRRHIVWGEEDHRPKKTSQLIAQHHLSVHLHVWVIRHHLMRTQWALADVDKCAEKYQPTVMSNNIMRSKPLFCHSELLLPIDLYPYWSTYTAPHHPSSWSCHGPGTLSPKSFMQTPKDTHTEQNNLNKCKKIFLSYYFCSKLNLKTWAKREQRSQYI